MCPKIGHDNLFHSQYKNSLFLLSVLTVHKKITQHKIFLNLWIMFFDRKMMPWKQTFHQEGRIFLCLTIQNYKTAHISYFTILWTKGLNYIQNFGFKIRIYYSKSKTESLLSNYLYDKSFEHFVEKERMDFLILTSTIICCLLFFFSFWTEVIINSPPDVQCTIKILLMAICWHQVNIQTLSQK